MAGAPGAAAAPEVDAGAGAQAVEAIIASAMTSSAADVVRFIRVHFLLVFWV